MVFLASENTRFGRLRGAKLALGSSTSPLTPSFVSLLLLRSSPSPYRSREPAPPPPSAATIVGSPPLSAIVGGGSRGVLYGWRVELDVVDEEERGGHSKDHLARPGALQPR